MANLSEVRIRVEGGTIRAVEALNSTSNVASRFYTITDQNPIEEKVIEALGEDLYEELKDLDQTAHETYDPPED